jgi:hypothetical protein
MRYALLILTVLALLGCQQQPVSWVYTHQSATVTLVTPVYANQVR